MVARLWIVFFIAFVGYSWLVYSYADVNNKEGLPDKNVLAGWQIWQDKNCQSCHQLYGLGGYLGPDLTDVSSLPQKGKKYMEVFIKNGTSRMPNFHLNDSEVNNVIQFLCWVDKSGNSQVPDSAVNWSGSFRIVN